MFEIEKKGLYVPKVAISGESGSGKTLAAIRLALGYCGNNSRVLFVDTENAARVYKGQGAFDIARIIPKDTATGSKIFVWSDFITAIDYAEKNKYNALVFDSLSDLWGGILDYKAELDAAGGNGLFNWRVPSECYKKVTRKILQSNIPIFATYRKKVEYIENVDASGKKSYIKSGTSPICREGADYDYSLWFDIARNHNATAGKTRFSCFDNFNGVITTATGAELKKAVDYVNSLD